MLKLSWQKVLPSVWLYRDSCNVYAVGGGDGMLIVNAGTGRWLDQLSELPARPAALACTHYFRDHSAGAALAAERGIPIYVAEGEREFFADPAEHFRRRETYIIYDNLWDLFVPIEAIPIAGVLRDYEKTRLAGVDVEVIPLPGASLMQIGLAVQSDGRRIVFCGEAIHSSGKLARVAPLQYNYNDLTGALNCYYAAQLLRNHQPDALLPSLGDPILERADAALNELQQMLRSLCADRPGMNQQMDMVHADPLEKVSDHVWRSAKSNSYNWFLISDSGKAMVLDYGYLWACFAVAYGLCKPYTRRSLLHGLDGLKQRFGIDRVDVALISHFHDDHVCGVPVLQRLHNTQCWAAENFADLLEKPDAHCFPCNWPRAITVNRRLPLDEPFQWEEYAFRLHAMNGHTRFSALIGWEADGKRFAHTGDQYFFQVPYVEASNDNQLMLNHVYRNGALLDGYEESARWLLDWKPDIILSGHQPAVQTSPKYFKLIEEGSRRYRAIHEMAMPLGEQDVHFNLDSWGGWIWPYRTHLKEPRAANVTVTVRNPFPHAAQLEVRLVGPKGWKGSAAKVNAEPRAEVRFDLTITPSGACRRQPFAAELIADGRPFGQVTEALMTVGGEHF